MTERNAEADAREALDALGWNAVLRLEQGQSTEQVEASLVTKGVAPEVAADIVRWAATSQGRAARPPMPSSMPAPPAPDPIFEKMHAGLKEGEGRADMLLGGFIFVTGIAITAATHSAAEASGGGPFVVAYGAIIYGLIRFFKGLLA